MGYVSKKVTGETISYQCIDYDLFERLDLNYSQTDGAFAEWLRQIEAHRSKNPGWSYRIEGHARNDYGNGYLYIYACGPATEDEYLAQVKAEKKSRLLRAQTELLRLEAELGED